MKYNKIYNWLVDWNFPISFVLFIGSTLLSGITQNEIYILIGWPIVLVFTIFCSLYLCVDWKDIKFWWRNRKNYILTSEERPIWENIDKKAHEGFDEWYKKTGGDDLCGPWIKDITPEEVNLLDKIHERYYGSDWCVAIPISTAQVCYVEYEDIKDKVK